MTRHTGGGSKELKSRRLIFKTKNRYMDENMTDLLKRSSQEIKSLRRQNELMSARLQVYDEMMQLFRTPPIPQGMGYSPDITYEIDKAIEAQSKPEVTEG